MEAIDFSAFEILTLSRRQAGTQITFESDGIAVNRAVIETLSFARYVQFLFNQETKQLVIAACPPTAPKAVPLSKGPDDARKRILFSMDTGFITEPMSWDPEKKMKVFGFYYSAENALLFSLEKAIPTEPPRHLRKGSFTGEASKPAPQVEPGTTEPPMAGYHRFDAQGA